MLTDTTSNFEDDNYPIKFLVISIVCRGNVVNTNQ